MRINTPPLVDSLLEQSYRWLLKTILLPIGDIVFQQYMIKRLNFLEKAQWWDPQKVTSYRDHLLEQVVEVAYNETKFYKNLFDQQNLTPKDIKTAKDLIKLPVVTKQMLLQGYPSETSRPTGQRVYEAKTSGSTGTNFAVLEDAYTAGWYRASFLLALEWSGWQIGARHLQTGMTLHRSFDRFVKDVLMRCYYVSAYDLRDEALDRSLEVIEKHKIKHVWGYPGSLYYLACRAQEQGWNQPLNSMVTWGDMLYQGYRSKIENTFKARIFDTYGCGEGIQVSAQCGEGDSYHIHSLDVIVEVLDRDGIPVVDSKEGDLVLTRLHAGPMPLIRYFVGDIGSLQPGKPCPCLRGFETMSAIKGRSADVVMTPNGNRLIVHFFTGILEHFSEIQSFQVIQEDLASIVIYIVLNGEPDENLAGRISDALKEKGASDISINIEYVHQIELQNSGKHKFIISGLSSKN